MTPGLEADIDRIDEIWMDCRRRFGASGGPWLFGEYSIADAMYAPVVLRFNTYRAQISDTARWYLATALEDADAAGMGARRAGRALDEPGLRNRLSAHGLECPPLFRLNGAFRCARPFA